MCSVTTQYRTPRGGPALGFIHPIMADKPHTSPVEEKPSPAGITVTIETTTTPNDPSGKKFGHTRQNDSVSSTFSQASAISTSSTNSEKPLIVNEKRLTYQSTCPTIVDLEAQTEEDEYKQKPLGRIRYAILTIYRRLFTVAFMGNAIAFIIMMIKGAAPMDLVNAAAVNIAVCGLCRQPLVINALFLIFGSIPRSAPIRIRRLACKIFHFGGVHSGTGVASVIWYIGFAAVFTYNYTPSVINTTVLTFVWLVLGFLLSIVIVAYPTFRMRLHDYFELTHRFANWIILVLFWILLILLGKQEANLGHFLLHLPAFWIIIVLTLATIHPWLLLRKIPVKPEPLSAHAIRLHFSHTEVVFGQGISVAKHPLKDWHSFACFTDKFDTPDAKFSCIVSKVGDWTKSTINDQPTHLWKRGVPTYGFGYVLRMFPKIIVVTTGSGIGPCLSFIEDANRPDMRVIWQTKSPLKTYGQRTLDLVHRMDSNPVILDTSITGRVDMLPIVLRLFKEFNAEAVCCISNPMMTKKIVHGCEMRGIPAYGPIFDS
ncbi:hypothetical protein B0T13DRAFT_497808 [Neurospora crassa]|nr:hypothetical protein B0T13DRAFT_497808 [Neurospora crassa]